MEIANELNRYSWKVIILITILVLVIFTVIYLKIGNTQPSDDIVNSLINHAKNEDRVAEIPDTSSLTDSICTGYWIDISGSVEQEGVYCMQTDQIISDVLRVSGGTTENACRPWIERVLNRAERVTEEKKLYIPSSTDKECLLLLNENKADSLGSGADTITVFEKKGFCTNGLISLNQADVVQLDTLPSVGPSLAQKIIDGRPYKSLDELKNISGVGEATYSKISPLVCL